MTNSEPQHLSHAELLKSMVSKFDNIMDHKVDIYIRQSHRMNSMIRVGMSILVVLGVSVMLLLYSLSTQVAYMLDGVVAMNSHFSEVESEMLDINLVLQKMENHMATLHSLDNNMARTDAELNQMRDRVQGIQQSMTGVNQRMDRLRQHLQAMNGQMSHMQNSLHGVSRETRQMSRPMRMVP